MNEPKQNCQCLDCDYIGDIEMLREHVLGTKMQHRMKCTPKETQEKVVKCPRCGEPDNFHFPECPQLLKETQGECQGQCHTYDGEENDFVCNCEHCSLKETQEKHEFKPYNENFSRICSICGITKPFHSPHPSSTKQEELTELAEKILKRLGRDDFDDNDKSLISGDVSKLFSMAIRQITAAERRGREEMRELIREYMRGSASLHGVTFDEFVKVRTQLKQQEGGK